MKQVVCKTDELHPGQMISGKLGPMPIVVVRTEDGQLYGLIDKCLHQGGPLSKGKIYTAQDGDTCGHYFEDGRAILKCPWHGYEYDLTTGATLFDENLKLQTFTVREEDGQVVAER